MKRVVMVFIGVLLAVAGVAAYSGDNDASESKVRIFFWNVENFFDYFDGGANSSDTEFSSRGERRWTKKRFLAKCNAVAKTILWASEGDFPEIVAFAEIENSFVLRKIAQTDILKKLDYKYIHYDSADPRGIDVGLLYRGLSLESSQPLRPAFPTRDALEARFVSSSGDSLAVFIVHLPSKLGGEVAQSRRKDVLDMVISRADSLAETGWTNALIAGDFNDGPSAFSEMLPCGYVNLSPAGAFSIRFDGKWELIDQAVAKGEIVDHSVMTVLSPDFLLTKDSSHSGKKPLRTYTGPAYRGGVSDHLPILVKVCFKPDSH